jgi:hypothetical protein
LKVIPYSHGNREPIVIFTNILPSNLYVLVTSFMCDLCSKVYESMNRITVLHKVHHRINRLRLVNCVYIAASKPTAEDKTVLGIPLIHIRDVQLQYKVTENSRNPVLINLYLYTKTTAMVFFLNRPLLPCGVEGFLLVNQLDNW